MRVGKCLEGSGALLSMVMVQVIVGGVQLLSKVILTRGSFIYAIVTYRNVVGAVCCAPFAFFLERGNTKKLDWSIFFWLFMSALTSMILAGGLFYYGLRDTTATYTAIFLNLIPVVTFAFSILLRMEKLGLDTKAGKIKILGVIVCVAGALIIVVYKGKSLHVGHHASSSHSTVDVRVKHNYTRGTAFLICCVVSYCLWFLVQVKLFKLYPYKYSGTMLTCVIAAVQATIVGLFLDRKKASWKLGWDLQLVTIIYSGSLATAATFCLTSWVVNKKGPTYPSMFNPVAPMIVVIIDTLFLGEAFTVGTLLSMLVILVGVYIFLSGKHKETKLLKKVADQELQKNNNSVAGEVSIIVNSESPKDSAFHSAEITPIPVPASDDHHIEDATVKKAFREDN